MGTPEGEREESKSGGQLLQCVQRFFHLPTSTTGFTQQWPIVSSTYVLYIFLMRGFCHWWFSNPPEHEIGTISHLEAESKWPPGGLVEWSLMDSHVLRHVNCHYVVSVWDYKAAIIKWILRGPIAYASTCFCFMMWLSIIFDLWFRRHFNKVIVLHIHNKLLRFVWEWWVMYLGSNEGNGEQVCCRWGHQEGIHRAGGGTAGICNDRRL